MTHIAGIDIQFYDTYNVIPSLLAILIIVGIPSLTKRMNKIIDRLLGGNKRIVILVLIINGLLELILIFMIYLSIVNLFQVREWYPGIDISNYIAIVVVVTTLLYLLTVIEIKTIKKITTNKERGC